jgi:hypothetical protein
MDNGFRADAPPFPRSLCRRAFCAKDIFRRASAEIERCEPDLRTPLDPFSDSIAVIAWSNFSNCAWALLLSDRS